MQFKAIRMIRIHTVNVGAKDSAWLRSLARSSSGVFLDLTSNPEDEGKKKEEDER